MPLKETVRRHGIGLKAEVLEFEPQGGSTHSAFAPHTWVPGTQVLLVDLDLKRRWHFGRVSFLLLNNQERWHRRRAAASAPAASGTRKATAEPTMISPAAVIRGQAHHSALAAPPLAPRATASSSTGSEAGRGNAARPWPRRRARSLMAAAVRAPAQSELGSTW